MTSKSSIKSSFMNMNFMSDDGPIPLNDSEIKLITNIHIHLLDIQEKILSGSSLSIDDTFNLFTSTISNRFTKSKKSTNSDPNSPQKPLSPYLYFSNDVRNSIKENLKSQGLPCSAVHISKSIASLWKSPEYRIYHKDGKYIDPSPPLSSPCSNFDYTDLSLKYIKIKDDAEKLYNQYILSNPPISSSSSSSSIKSSKNSSSFKMPITLFMEDPDFNHLIPKFQSEYLLKYPSASISSPSCKSYVKSSMHSIYYTLPNEKVNFYKDLSRKSKLSHITPSPSIDNIDE